MWRSRSRALLFAGSGSFTTTEVRWLSAAEQRTPGRTEAIEWEDANGKWHTETASGSDRPETDVEDSKS